jgi:Spy/CpxP family protein refolding chaperone
MKLAVVVGVFSSLCLYGAASQAAPASAYAGQEAREIKALSAEEVGDLMAGKGMGLAKAAELNGYAGPAHVLELADALELTPEQRAQTQALKAAMTAKAIPLGHAVVTAERQLDLLFSTKTITPALLRSALDELGALQARVRGVHLEAHLAQVVVLTSDQNARYSQLRGYAGDATTAPQTQSQHKH